MKIHFGLSGDQLFFRLIVVLLITQFFLRAYMAPILNGIDDVGYLDAAHLLASGGALSDIDHPLFRFRVGMSLPLAILVSNGVLDFVQYWMLTVLTDLCSLILLALAARHLWGRVAGGVVAVLWALYPLTYSQSLMFMPTTFQGFTISGAIYFLVKSSVAKQAGRSLLLAALAGVLLGLGYLVKEDTALVVILVFIGGVAVQPKRWLEWVFFAGGAASIFFAELLSYYLLYGDALIRVTGSSGNAAEVSGHISGLWQWDAFFRSLLVMPYQVGLYWWLAFFAVIAAFRHKDMNVHWLTCCFLLIMCWAQFGSGSFTEYSPLPKSPRYTIIATPFLILLLGWWFTVFCRSQPQRALVLGCAVVSVSVLCISFIAVQANERTRNTNEVVKVLSKMNIKEIYTDYYSARLVNVLMREQVAAKVLYHANFSESAKIAVLPKVSLLEDLCSLDNKYVLIDLQQSKLYTDSYEIPLPVEVKTPPHSWTVIWEGRAYDGISRNILAKISSASSIIPVRSITERVQRFISGMIDGDTATLFLVSTKNMQCSESTATKLSQQKHL